MFRDEGRMNTAKYREVFKESLLQGAHDLMLEQRFTFQGDNYPELKLEYWIV